MYLFVYLFAPLLSADEAKTKIPGAGLKLDMALMVRGSVHGQRGQDVMMGVTEV